MMTEQTEKILDDNNIKKPLFQFSFNNIKSPQRYPGGGPCGII